MKLPRSLSLISASLISTLCFASAPQLKTQAPGFYRMKVGKFEVTPLFDGFFPMKPSEILPKSAAKQIDQGLQATFQGETIPTSVNAFLINTGTRLIMVDAGCGTFFGPAFGKLMENLKASGYSPEQVDEIEITHMHSDHLGGVVAAGKAAFPNAVLRVDQKDADYWLNIENSKGTQEPLTGMFANAVASVAPYKASGHFKTFQGKTEIAPGITAIPNYGHTPGHTVFSVESDGKKLLLIGDLLHIEAIQFPHPELSLAFDADPKQAAAQRRKVLSDAATQKFLIGASHLPFPGIGHVSPDKAGFKYLPVPYAPLQ